jgi:hypothetical protein
VNPWRESCQASYDTMPEIKHDRNEANFVKIKAHGTNSIYQVGPEHKSLLYDSTQIFPSIAHVRQTILTVPK